MPDQNNTNKKSNFIPKACGVAFLILVFTTFAYYPSEKPTPKQNNINAEAQTESKSSLSVEDIEKLKKLLNDPKAQSQSSKN